MVGERFGRFSEPAFAALLQRLGDLSMQVGSAVGEQALIDGVAQEDVLEQIVGGVGVAINDVLRL